MMSKLVCSMKLINRCNNRLFSTGTALLKQAGSTKKTTAFTKKSGPANTSKRVISLEQVKPIDWKLPQASNVLVAEMNKENVNDKNVNTVFGLPSLAKTKLNKLLPKFLEKEFNFVSEAGLLLRKSSLELFQLADKYKDNQNELPVIIDGALGIGKSASLLQLVAYCIMSKEWIVLYSPNSINWVNGTNAYDKDADSTLYKQVHLAKQFLQDTLKINKELLESITLEQDKTHSKASYAKGTSIVEVVQEGISDINLTDDCINILVDVLANQKNHPVLLAVDQINHFFGKTAYHDINSKVINADQLSFVNLVNKFFKGQNKFHKGLVIGANSYIETKYSSKEFSNAKNDTKEQISLSGFKFQSFKLENYNNEESLAIAKYYNEASIAFNEWSTKEVNRKFMISNGNPKAFFKAAVCPV